MSALNLGQGNWRDTARPLRFFVFDARVLVLLLVWAAHLCLETFVLALLGMFFFAALELFGLSLGGAVRSLQCALLGPFRPVSWEGFFRRNCL